ncbi:response regulator [Fibrella sp. HMF5335]|uniref:Response regulator n=1 Tax=Fibrella rubiginis TaxID=2817060 RepID=A0A939GFG5_9BACT|nr:response regulator [Fibrella rubiginis]MBO0936269.1 response regulator [Fibrella rubiginis]
MLDILYIEDNIDEADIFKRVISRLPTPPTYKIIMSGTEAIDYLLQQGTHQGQSLPMPRLVLVDLNLPGQSGFDVIQQVRANNRTRYMPMVVYSTSDSPKDMRRAFDLGANAYLIKPGSYHEVSDMIRRAIEFWLTQNHYKP